MGVVLRLMLNLSFDQSIREVMLKSGAIPKLAGGDLNMHDACLPAVSSLTC